MHDSAHDSVHEATRAQIEAATPAESTWLSANAGSGKTKVLTDRVARLLLRGAEPQRILCLTYTKAAAAEMQNRLFARLGSWAMMPEADLRKELADLGEAMGDDPSVLAASRRLFARAIEAPGGLKIQTIHAFCGALLRRFPLEAGVPPDFREADERSLKQLRLEVLDRLAHRPEAALFRDLVEVVGEEALDRLLDDLGRYRDVFRPGAALPDRDALFDLPGGLDLAGLVAGVWFGGEGAMIDALLPVLSASSPNDRKLAEALAAARDPSVSSLIRLEKALLFTGKAAAPHAAKVGSIPTKPVREALDPVLRARFEALMLRVEAARPRRIALQAAARAGILHRFAAVWVPAIEAAKAERGWLDFDDLVLRARALLGDPAVAQWVLFRLDGGIDHILIDEAQDTSPEQWQVIERLTEEFTAGRGARETLRTIFVVGDRKQSIYSFQGADLRGFDRMQARFGTALADIGQRLHARALIHSFRSSGAVLQLVDRCFEADTGANGLGGAVRHLAFHPERPGRVDLWPLVPKAGTVEADDWDAPLDRPSEAHHQLVLARAVATGIRAAIDGGEQIVTVDGPRPVHEGDFLILVRGRALFFDAVIRACKAQELAVAGADRLKLGEAAPVQDLIALLRFLALTDDDLSLAVALRSPLFAWDEDALFRLAHGRPQGQGLWEALRGDPGAAPARAVLSDLLDRVDFLRPYELIERILTRHEGRKRLLARFGPEAEEAIEAFVALALGYEEGHVPSLDGFLAWLEADDVEIKRQPEAAGRRVRVMTVHGAKGLEAEVVVLADTIARRPPREPALLDLGGVPALRQRAEEAPPAQIAADAARDADRRAEGDRLLYVALTRARSWLIVAGAGEDDGADDWYPRIARALDTLAPAACDFPTGRGVRLEQGAWPPPHPLPAAETVPAHPPLAEPARPLPAPAIVQPVSPAALGGAKALPGEGAAEEVALRRGRLVHLLLEHLPVAAVAQRRSLGMRLIATHTGPEDEAAACLDEALALLESPELAPVFAPGALVEVSLCGAWKGRPMSGVIDRLLIGPERVLAVDFKSNRVIPSDSAAIPEGLLRQMGAYAHLLRPLYPGRRIETALLWTAVARLMPVPGALADAALERAALDPGNGGP